MVAWSCHCSLSLMGFPYSVTDVRWWWQITRNSYTKAAVWCNKARQGELLKQNCSQVGRLSTYNTPHLCDSENGLMCWACPPVILCAGPESWVNWVGCGRYGMWYKVVLGYCVLLLSSVWLLQEVIQREARVGEFLKRCVKRAALQQRWCWTDVGCRQSETFLPLLLNQPSQDDSADSSLPCWVLQSWWQPLWSSPVSLQRLMDLAV